MVGITFVIQVNTQAFFTTVIDAREFFFYLCTKVLAWCIDPIGAEKKYIVTSIK